MRFMAAAAVLAASPVVAETITCDLAGTVLTFTIDHNQFVAAQDPNDPPRRKVTLVRFGDKQFPAEPIVMGAIRGFHAEGLGGTAALFIIQPDGSAVLSNRSEGQRIDGTCQAD